jgi:hypothetical protein
MGRDAVTEGELKQLSGGGFRSSGIGSPRHAPMVPVTSSPAGS